jgi:hypothetical protein
VKTEMVGIEKRLRLAGMLLIIGLGVEAICLQWARPIAFILLVAFGGALCAGGIAVYLYSLACATEAKPEP